MVQLDRAALLLIALLPACASAGRNFHEERIPQLQPGRTTYAEAVEILGAPPVNRFFRDDGSLIAAWQYVYVAPGAFSSEVKENKSLSVMFDRNLHMVRVVGTINIDLPDETRTRLKTMSEVKQ